jgi:prepilin-type N-terminal cleavage/methylation domain-containing protein
MQSGKKKNSGMTILELVVVIAVFGIFMGIAIPSVSQSFRSISQAKRLTSRYPDARRALDAISEMVRRTYPPALSADTAFIGRSNLRDVGGLRIPSDELTFPVLDTDYARLRAVQKISYRLEENAGEAGAPVGLVQTRSFLGASAEAGITGTVLETAAGLDFKYLDDSVTPSQWLDEWPPASGEPNAAGTVRPSASGASDAQSIRLPKAVKITVFTLGEISRRPTSFTTTVNIPSK